MRRRLTWIAVVLAIAPLLVSLAWREGIGACDYLAQSGIVALMTILPFLNHPESGFRNQLILIWSIGLAWGIWRISYFDVVTENDVPGMGYIVSAFMFGAVSAVIFSIRKWMYQRKQDEAISRQAEPMSDDLIIYPIPSLVATLLNRENSKGAPLTEGEVISIRDSAPSVALTRDDAAKIDERRGYLDIDPENCWAEWQRARLELKNTGDEEA